MKHFVTLKGGVTYQLEKPLKEYRRRVSDGNTGVFFEYPIAEALSLDGKKVKNLWFLVESVVASWSEELTPVEKKQEETDEKEKQWKLIFDELKKKALEEAAKELEEKEKNKGILADWVKKQKPGIHYPPPFNPNAPYQPEPWKSEPFAKYPRTTLGPTFQPYNTKGYKEVFNINPTINGKKE